MGHVQAQDNVRRESVALALLICCCSLKSIVHSDLDGVVFANSVLCIVAFKPVPVGVQTLAITSFECVHFLHHLTPCSLAAVVLPDVGVDPLQACGFRSDV